MDKDILNPDYYYFNGLNGTRGGYATPPMSHRQMLNLLKGVEPPAEEFELQRILDQGKKHYGLPMDVDPRCLAECGWGAIFSADADCELQMALAPLLKFRRQQAGSRFKLFTGETGFQEGDTKSSFLARLGTAYDVVDPDTIPYYLLIVGDPQTIPFRFQSQLSLAYAVGRICFDDLDSYRHYARTLVNADTGNFKTARRFCSFAPQNANDLPTERSLELLAQPLVKNLRSEFEEWDIQVQHGENASKTVLTELLGGEDSVPLLFTASHAMAFDSGREEQMPNQGALICQDWPGPQEAPRPVGVHYFTGMDLLPEATLDGMIAFFFGCFSLGTPHWDHHSRKKKQKQRQAIAPSPFLADLPRKMLGRLRGAGAVIGYMDRAYGYSFCWPGVGRQTGTYRETMRRLMVGLPVGHALKPFTERYAELSSDLASMLDDLEFDDPVDPDELLGTWTAHNDARAIGIMGDPAARVVGLGEASNNPKVGSNK